METNIGDKWFGHGVEETIVDNDDQRGDNIIALRKLRVSHIVFTNLIVFSWNASFFFVVDDLTFQFNWKLIDSISSVVLIHDPESILFVFIIAETGKCSIDVLSFHCVGIRWLIVILPGVVSFFLVFYFGVMWNLCCYLCSLFYVSLWEVFFIALILFIQSLLVNIWIL